MQPSSVAHSALSTEPLQYQGARSDLVRTGCDFRSGIVAEYGCWLCRLAGKQVAACQARASAPRWSGNGRLAAQTNEAYRRGFEMGIDDANIDVTYDKRPRPLGQMKSDRIRDRAARLGWRTWWAISRSGISSLGDPGEVGRGGELCLQPADRP